MLTTRHAVTVGEIRSEWRDDLLRVIGEITTVAEAEGAALDADKIVAFVDGLPYGMKSSMQRDAEAGRPTELDALGGAVLRAAGRHEIKVPCLAALVDDLKAGLGGTQAPGV